MFMLPLPSIGQWQEEDFQPATHGSYGEIIKRRAKEPSLSAERRDDSQEISGIPPGWSL